MGSRAAVGMGSNMGDREAHIITAFEAIAELGTSSRLSGLYETAPIGGREQASYLNSVAVLDTDLSPTELLEALLTIEQAHGRVRREKWGPRTLDLDLLLYGDETIAEPGLTVPHPRMTQRLFVLAPLLELWPDATLPGGSRLDRYLAGLSDQAIARYEGPAGVGLAGALIFVTTAVLALIVWFVVGMFL